MTSKAHNTSPPGTPKGRGTGGLVVTFLSSQHAASPCTVQQGDWVRPHIRVPGSCLGGVDGGPKPTAHGLARIKEIHSPHTAVGRAAGGSK